MVRIGTFPFGAPLRTLVQTDRAPKKLFVLGVYASAVHARWKDRDGRLLVQALAVASEPVIFWDGAEADRVVRGRALPAEAGTLEAAAAKFNGPSGRSLDRDFLLPLGVGRDSAWLCDLVPHACANAQQREAIERAYAPREKTLGLPAVDLPDVPKRLASAARCGEILEEVHEAHPEVIVLLGDQPIRHWLNRYDRRYTRLADFGTEPTTYGRVHPVSIEGSAFHVLPLAHPRQVSGLGRHSREWRRLHETWKGTAAASVRPSDD